MNIVKKYTIGLLLSLALSVASFFGASAEPAVCLHPASEFNAEMAAFKHVDYAGEDFQKFIAAYTELSGEKLPADKFDAIEIFDFDKLAGWALFKDGCLVATAVVDSELNHKIADKAFGERS